MSETRRSPAAGQLVSVDGRRITLTHLEKVLYPETGTTKADVLGYYAAVADVLIAHAANRPATRKRWVHGVGTADSPAHVFFQKNLDESTPDWVRRRSIRHSDHVNDYPLVNDRATLTWLAQMTALEIHVPQWQFDREGSPRNPDRLVLDLDPGDGVSLADCAEVARLARSILRDMGLDPLPVTSGSKGIHLYAALDLSHTADQVSAVAHELARALEADHPKLVVSDMRKARRAGRVFVDWSQNNAAKTTIAPYSLRGTARPMVAMPRTWRELASPGLAQLDYRQAMHRVERGGDPLAALLLSHAPTAGPGGSAAGDDTDATGPGVAGHPGADRLAVYRSRRDGAKTPEPVPAGSAAATAGVSFVIQEHHARSLHFDLRLEHDGVLVSWALPRGVPTDPARNHLAVRTEDHPLEYGQFEGTIPAGEYGAGTVAIWDRGRYQLEKWRDDEVIATLHGAPGGGLGQARRFALIRTTGSGRAPDTWLIHLMKPVTGRGILPRDSAPQPTRYAPMLATAGSVSELAGVAETGRRDPAGEWAFEMKWDGIRALAYLSGSAGTGTVRLVSRTGREMSEAFPELVRALPGAVSAAAVVLDGEIVAIDPAGRPNFGLLQSRFASAWAGPGRARTSTAPGPADAPAAAVPVQYLIFDILDLNGATVTDRPYSERREILSGTVASTGVVQVPPSFPGDADAAMRASRELGLEGIVAKDTAAGYQAGRRSRSWIKVKHRSSQEVVIGGWRPGTGRRSGTVGSLLMGLPGVVGTGRAAALDYIGRVGTGFRDRDLDDLRDRLATISQTASPFADVPAADARDARWVSPTLVGEVEFAEWTRSGRLRHPAWRGWRTDKSAAAVQREST